MTQSFKGDSVETKMRSVADPVFDLTNASLDDFYDQGFDASPFLLMLYDNGKIPYSQRIKRDYFVVFIKEALKRFPVIGTFESYVFILTAIFGEFTEINFEVPGAGKLAIDITAADSVEFEFVGREFEDGVFSIFNIVDYDGSLLIFRGIPGIQSEYDLELLFSEIIPAGIFPDTSLSFYTRYDFVAEEDSVLYQVIDNNGHQIIFYEVGG